MQQQTLVKNFSIRTGIPLQSAWILCMFSVCSYGLCFAGSFQKTRTTGLSATQSPGAHFGHPENKYAMSSRCTLCTYLAHTNVCMEVYNGQWNDSKASVLTKGQFIVQVTSVTLPKKGCRLLCRGENFFLSSTSATKIHYKINPIQTRTHIVQHQSTTLDHRTLCCNQVRAGINVCAV